MSKNKLAWIFGLILLITIISLPIAYAQIVTAGSQLYFLLINAAIIFVVLFALQSFLIPQKPDKERTAVWVIVIVASLLLAYLFGQTGYLWAEGQPLARFFSIPVLVNAVIIAAVLYFVLGWMKVGNLNSPEGKGGYAILIFLVALIFAVKIGNQWIWDQSVVRQFIAYLFGAEGILNPSPPAYRLWTFLVSATLLAFFFSGYLIKNVPGGNKINYALAILIAMTLARSGTNFQRIVILGEVIFLIVLAEALKGTSPNVKGFNLNWVIAGFLVGWASAAMTYGTEYQGWLAWIVGTPLYYAGFITLDGTTVTRPTGTGWFGWIGKMMLGALALILIILALMFVIGRSEEREQKMTTEARKRVLQEIKHKLRRNKIMAFFMSQILGSRNEFLPDELPFEIKDMRLEIYTLLNWMLRHEVWKLKSAALKKVKAEIERAESILEKQDASPEIVIRNLNGHIEGSEVVDVGDRWDLKVPENPEEGETTPGWGRSYYVVVRLMNELQNRLQNKNVLLGNPPDDKEKDKESLANNLKKQIVMDWWGKHINNRYNKYKSAIRRFKVANLVRTKSLYVYDMENMFGQNVRGMLFVKPDAQAYECDYTAALDKSAGVTWEIDFDKVNVSSTLSNVGSNYEAPDKLAEINIYGFATSDINAIQTKCQNVRLRKYPKYRVVEEVDPNDPTKKIKVLKEQTNLFHVPKGGRWNHVADDGTYEWDFAVFDMETGGYHPMSKKAADYRDYIRYTHEKFSNATIKAPLTTREIAFDREALKIPHTVNYWGKPNYFDIDPNSPRKFPANPYPAISLKGLWYFIFEYTKRAAPNEKRTEDILKQYFKMQYDEVEITAKEGKNE